MRFVNPIFKNDAQNKRINMVYNYNHKITEIFKDKSWQNKVCFIIGGGESLEGFNFNLLKNQLVIGTNKTFIYYPQITINYSMDVKFYNNIMGLSTPSPEFIFFLVH